jgi:hypothetical protein
VSVVRSVKVNMQGLLKHEASYISLTAHTKLHVLSWPPLTANHCALRGACTPGGGGGGYMPCVKNHDILLT